MSVLSSRRGRTRIGEHVGSHASLVGSCGATMSDERPCAVLAP
jgi:hypothetical protein